MPGLFCCSGLGGLVLVKRSCCVTLGGAVIVTVGVALGALG
jgi:hypothetical protein